MCREFKHNLLTLDIEISKCMEISMKYEIKIRHKTKHFDYLENISNQNQKAVLILSHLSLY